MPGEIVPHREFYDYTAKYLEGGTRLEIPAKLTKAQMAKIREYAVRAYQAIDCTGMARADFFLERKSGRIFVNEIEYDSWIYLHQHVPKDVGGFRAGLYEID